MEWLQTTWGNNLFFALFGFWLAGLLVSMWTEYKIRHMCDHCKRKMCFQVKRKRAKE